MAQILDPIPNDHKDSILCCYVNATSHIQVVRITNIPNWYFERVVFPGQRLIFEAVSKALLEINSGMMASAILSDTIPCERLSISEGSDDDDELDAKPITLAATADNNTSAQKKTDSKPQPVIVAFKTALVSAN